MIKVICNIDDVGLHPAVNRSLEYLKDHGIVTSASVLANGPYINEVKNFKEISYGAHLNILRGTPLSNSEEIKSLVNREGNFCGSLIRFLFRYYLNLLDYSEIELEWSRQIESLIERGFNSSHLDSEKHLHSFPEIFKVVERLSEKYGIKWIRNSHEASCGSRFTFNSFKVKVLQVLNNRKTKVKSVDYIWGVADQGMLSPQNFEKYLKIMEEEDRDTLIELCVHPGNKIITDPSLEQVGTKFQIDKSWSQEHESLSTDNWKKVFSDYNVTLTNFNQV